MLHKTACSEKDNACTIRVRAQVAPLIVVLFAIVSNTKSVLLRKFLPMADIEDDNNDTPQNKNKGDKQPFTLDTVLAKVKGERDGKAKKAFETKIAELDAKRVEAEKSVKIIEKQMLEEYAKYQEGLV